MWWVSAAVSRRWSARGDAALAVCGRAVREPRLREGTAPDGGTGVRRADWAPDDDPPPFRECFGEAAGSSVAAVAPSAPLACAACCGASLGAAAAAGAALLGAAASLVVVYS